MAPERPVCASDPSLSNLLKLPSKQHQSWLAVDCFLFNLLFLQAFSPVMLRSVFAQTFLKLLNSAALPSCRPHVRSALRTKLSLSACPLPPTGQSNRFIVVFSAEDRAWPCASLGKPSHLRLYCLLLVDCTCANDDTNDLCVTLEDQPQHSVCGRLLHPRLDLKRGEEV